MAMTNLGDVLGAQGDLPGSIRTLERTQAAYREMGDKGFLATSLLLSGDQYESHGDLAKAHHSLEEALRIGREIDQRITVAGALSDLSAVAVDEGDLAAATTMADEALAITRTLSSKLREAGALLAFANIAAGRGQAADLERYARAVLDASVGDKSPRIYPLAYDYLAQSQLLRGNVPAAREAMAQGLAIPNVSIVVRLQLASTAARVDESRSRSDARKQLQAVADEATRKGYRTLAFNARLALGEIELRAGAREAGRTRLAALGQEAAARGFALIASKARAAAAR
jgi:hypothetical protein